MARPTKAALLEREWMASIGRKRCSRDNCTDKPLDEFWDNQNAWDGKQSRCIECSKNAMDPWRRLFEKPLELLEPAFEEDVAG